MERVLELILDENSKGLEGRLFRAYRQYNYLCAIKQGLLFQSSKAAIQKRIDFIWLKVVRKLVCRLSTHELGTNKFHASFRFYFISGERLSDVRAKYNQRYRLTVSYTLD